MTTAPGRVVVVGLGPAGPELCSEATRRAIADTPARFLRTARHPAAAIVPDARTFDDIYDAGETIEAVYRAIVETLADAANDEGAVLYAVPGSPVVAERTVQLLRADSRVQVELVPAMSCLDLAWTRLGIDPVAESVRVVDGHRFAVDAAGERGGLLVLQCDQASVLSDIKLAVGDSPPDHAVVLQRLGLRGERVATVPWCDLDRDVEADHLTSLWIPVLAAPIARELVAAVELGRELRERCPWDREQTHASLVPFLLEEAYETVDAIQALESGAAVAEAYAHLEEELGDLFFQIVFHSTLAAEAGQFTIADVARGIHDKLVRRHPHVFGDGDATTAGQVVRTWEELKQEEKGRHGVFDGVPHSLPALLHAAEVQSRASAVGFDWDDVEQVYPKITEELAELRDRPSEEELGDLLFATVNAARHLGVDPEAALRGATTKFRSRFEAVERLAGARGVELSDLDLAGLDALWEEVKDTNGRP